MIKQICSSRRRPGMTRREYFDYRFQVHGSIADGGEKPEDILEKYIQTHVFDSVYGARPGPVPNANHAWMARDDVTELFYRDWDHMMANMRSDYVRDKVGPDAPFFADFESAMVLLAKERQEVLPVVVAAEADERNDDTSRFVAMFFVAPPDGVHEKGGTSLDATLTPLLVDALADAVAAGAVRSPLMVNVAIADAPLDPTQYFGGKDMPRYVLVYKIVLGHKQGVGVLDSVAAVRKAQALLADKAAGLYDESLSYTLFGREGLVMDASKNIRFDGSRQPDLSGL